MLNACKEITKNPDNLGKIFSYLGYLRENEGEGRRGGGFMVSVAGIIRTMTRLITPSLFHKKKHVCTIPSKNVLSS